MGGWGEFWSNSLVFQEEVQRTIAKSTVINFGKRNLINTLP